MKTERKRKVLIVGGSRGLGFSLALSYCRRRGYETVILSRTVPPEAIDAEIVLTDATQVGIAEHCLRQIEPDSLIINFAEGIYRQPELLTDEEIRQAIKINAAGAISWINAAVRLLPTEAKIGWISSLTALIPDENWAIYAATKAAVSHFIECVRPLAARRGIGLTVCFPGCLRTDFHTASGATHIPPDAVSPDEIVVAMGDAIEAGREFWAARMDAPAVEQFYDLRKEFLERTKGGVR